MHKLYFLGRDNKIYTNTDIIKSALICSNKIIETDEEVRQYSNYCKGIERELSSISVEDLVIRGAHVEAVILYRETHDCCLAEAREYVLKIEESLRNKQNANNLNLTNDKENEHD